MAASAPRSSRRPLLPRRARCLAVAALLFAGVLACGSQGGGEETGPASNASESTVFPVTITHAFGTSVVPAEPKRVVAIGFNESDFLLALGVRPVGVRDFIGEFPEDTRVWAKKQAGNSRPEKVGGQEVNIEKVAALRPDLIMGIYSSIDKPTYDKLARIAPTIGPESTTTSTTWQDQTLITGKALGREGQAKKVVADVETRIAALTKEHPEFKGKRLAIAFGPDISTGTYVLPPSDLRTQMFTDLGFVVPDQTEQISREQFGLLDQELVAVIGTEQKVSRGTAGTQPRGRLGGQDRLLRRLRQRVQRGPRIRQSAQPSLRPRPGRAPARRRPRRRPRHQCQLRGRVLRIMVER